MKLIDWIAIIGALAWLPPIITMIKNWLTKAEVRVIAAPNPEIGFTSLGPIFNLRLALSAKHKDIVITSIKVRIQHESGEETCYSWRGIVQKMGHMTYPEIGAVPFEKESNVLAMKANTRDIEERFIRFQSHDFLTQKSEIESSVIKQYSHLYQTGNLEQNSFLNSLELRDLYAFNRQFFTWKPGRYKVSVELSSPEDFSILDNKYTFILTPLQSEELSSNRDLIESHYLAELFPTPEWTTTHVPWKWIYPDFQKTQ